MLTCRDAEQTSADHSYARHPLFVRRPTHPTIFSLAERRGPYLSPSTSTALYGGCHSHRAAVGASPLVPSLTLCQAARGPRGGTERDVGANGKGEGAALPPTRGPTLHTSCVK